MFDETTISTSIEYDLMSFSIFEYLFHQFMDKDTINDNLQLMIAFIRKKSFVCLNYLELHKLYAIVISLKAHITLSILKEFDRRYSSPLDLSIVNVCIELLSNEFVFIEKYLEKLEIFFDGFPGTKEFVRCFRREIITLKKPIVSGHYRIWSSYINTFRKEITRFHELFIELSPCHLKSVEDYSSSIRPSMSSSVDRQKVIPYRRLKIIMNRLYSSSIDLSNVWKFLGRSDAAIDIEHLATVSKKDIDATVEHIRQSFRDKYDWITIEELARSEGNKINTNSDVDIDSIEKNGDHRKRQLSCSSNLSERTSSTASTDELNDVAKPTVKVSKPNEMKDDVPSTSHLHEESARSEGIKLNIHSDVDFYSIEKNGDHRKRQLICSSNLSERTSSTTSTDNLIDEAQPRAKVSKPNEMKDDVPSTSHLHANGKKKLFDIESQSQILDDMTSNSSPLRLPVVEIVQLKRTVQFNDNYSTASNYRTAWNMDETYLIFKGVKQGLKWAQIKNAYFSNSQRTNIQIKDRWRVVVANPTLYKELDDCFNSDRTTYKSVQSDVFNVGKNLVTCNDNNGADSLIKRSNLEPESPVVAQEQRQPEVNEITDNSNSKRVTWTFEETFCIYKGRQQNLSWAEIKATYFRVSRRTNVQIKDRWRVVESKPDLLNSLIELYNRDQRNA